MIKAHRRSCYKERRIILAYKLELVTDAICVVAESPIWNERDKKLYYVDIQGKRMRTVSLETNEISDMVLPQQIGCLAFDEDNNPICGMEDGIYRINIDQSMTKLNRPFVMKGIRFNDGKIGPDGKYYLGTMSREMKGAFYCMDSTGIMTELFDGVGNSNGLDWDVKRDLFYFNDTPTYKTDAFTFKDGKLSDRRTVTKYHGIGNPDGMTMDMDGMLWVALWGGYRIVRLNPYSGEIIDYIELPVANVASCIFGGDDFSELFITTASHYTDLREQPLAGSVFRVKTQTCGKPIYRFKGDRKYD